MPWTWGEIAGIGSLCMTLVLAAERIIGRLIKGQYVTREELRAAERSMSDSLLLEGRLRSDLDTRLKLLEANMTHMPTADDVVELKEKISALSEGLAVNNVRLEHISEETHQTRLSIDRLSDELRKRG